MQNLFDRKLINQLFVATTKHGLIGHEGRGKAWSVDPVTGARDLIYDPADPDQKLPFGCLLNRRAARRLQPLSVVSFNAALLGSAAELLKEIPTSMILGEKALGGGLGLDVCNPSCNQGNLGSCVGACGTNVSEDTMKSEFKLRGELQDIPDVSIRYVYFFAQGYYDQPGGSGAMTSGLANAFQTYTDGWVNGRYSDMMGEGGRCGGLVHEAAFAGSADLSDDLKNGMPYDINACNRGSKFSKAWVDLGIKHRVGYQNGACVRVQNWEQYQLLVASGHIAFTGISWPGAWGDVDKDGWCVSGWRGSSGGHELEFCGYTKRLAQSGFGGSNTHTRAVAEGDDWWVQVKNSWGYDWAFHGSALIPKAQFERAGVYDEMYGVSFADGWDKTVVLDWLAAGRRF